MRFLTSFSLYKVCGVNHTWRFEAMRELERRGEENPVRKRFLKSAEGFTKRTFVHIHQNGTREIRVLGHYVTSDSYLYVLTYLEEECIDTGHNFEISKFRMDRYQAYRGEVSHRLRTPNPVFQICNELILLEHLIISKYTLLTMYNLGVKNVTISHSIIQDVYLLFDGLSYITRLKCFRPRPKKLVLSFESRTHVPRSTWFALAADYRSDSMTFVINQNPDIGGFDLMSVSTSGEETIINSYITRLQVIVQGVNPFSIYSLTCINYLQPYNPIIFICVSNTRAVELFEISKIGGIKNLIHEFSMGESYVKQVSYFRRGHFALLCPTEYWDIVSIYRAHVRMYNIRFNTLSIHQLAYIPNSNLCAALSRPETCIHLISMDTGKYTTISAARVHGPELPPIPNVIFPSVYCNDTSVFLFVTFLEDSDPLTGKPIKMRMEIRKL